MKRIRRLLGPQRVNTSWTPLIAAAVLITTAVAAYAAWPSKPLTQSSAATQGQAERAETSPYQRWLNEEVPYIIEAKEREAFLKLTTDEEREKFIEAFWERRNPHPGGPVDEFKIEYYRRLAYANRQYASASKTGWKTDRGRMYIMYGPPDEIDSHPGNKPHPFEMWKYRYVDGVGSNVVLKFAYSEGIGEYHLQMPQALVP